MIKLAAALQSFRDGIEVSNEDEQRDNGEDASDNGKAAEQISKQGNVDMSGRSANAQGGTRLVGLTLHEHNRATVQNGEYNDENEDECLVLCHPHHEGVVVRIALPIEWTEQAVEQKTGYQFRSAGSQAEG